MTTLRAHSLLVIGILLTTISACAPTRPTIRVDSDKSIDLAGYRTFAFVPQLGTDRAGYSSLITSHFKDATRQEMEKRGYAYSEDAPQLFLNFNVNVREQAEVRSYPSASVGYYGYRSGMYGGMYGTDVDTVHYKVGTANVDVVDASRKQLVWVGVAEGRLSEQAMKDPRTAIATVVGEIMQQFPAAAPR